MYNSISLCAQTLTSVLRINLHLSSWSYLGKHLKDSEEAARRKTLEP